MAYESRLEISVNTRGAERNLKAFEGQLNKAEQSGERAAGAIGGGLTRALGLAAAAVGGFSIGRVISEAAGFEDAMLGLAAVSGATASQMADLEKQARTLGATSMFSAQQAGDAQRYLAMAGFEVNEILSATPGLLDLAAAGQMGLAEAADIASNVLGGMRLEVDQLGRVNDVLAATASGANTSISQLGQALSYAAPFAAAAHISLEETAAAIGAMSDAGIQAGRAGTGLIGIIRQLSSITPRTASALASAGIAVSDVDISTRGLVPVLETLYGAGIDVTQAIDIFGSEAGAAALNVIEASDKVDDFSKQLENAEGAANRMALIIGSGLTGSMRSFSSMVSESVLQIGESGLTGGFKGVLDSASGVLSVYNRLLPEFAEANDLSEEQSDNLQSLAGNIRAVTLVIGGATSGLVAYRGAAVLATAAQWALGAAVTATPLGLIATLAGAAAGALYLYRDELGLVDVAAENAQIALNGYAEAIGSGNAAALDANYSNLINALEAVSLQAQEAMTQLTELTARQRFYENSHQGVASSLAAAISEEEQALAALWERQVKLQTAIRKNREERDGLNTSSEVSSQAMDDLIVTAERLTSGTDKLTKAQREAEKEAKRFADSLQSLTDRLYPVEAAQRTYAEEQALLTKAWNEGTITADRYTEAMQRLERAQLSTQAASTVYNQGFGAEIGSRGDVGSPTDQASYDKLIASATEANKLGKDLGLTFSSAFEDAVIEGNKFRDVLTGIAEDIQRILLRRSVTEPAANAFSNGISGVNWGGPFGFGGSSSSGGFMSNIGFANGGYTGDGNKYDPAGIVHAGEFVVKKSVVDKPGVRPALESLNRGYANGGYVGGGSVTGMRQAPVKVEIIDQRSGGQEAQVQQTTGADGQQKISILIRDKVKEAFSNGSMDRTMANNY